MTEHLHTDGCLVFFDSMGRPTRNAGYASVGLGCDAAKEEAYEAMEADEVRFERQQQLLMIDRPITVKRWWKLKAVWIEKQQRYGFVIDEPRPRGDDRAQFDSPNFIVAAHQGHVRYEGQGAVGRYWSHMHGGSWEVWTNDALGIPVCISYDRARIESGPRAAQRLLGGRLS
jgi:hypothetical protein